MVMMRALKELLQIVQQVLLFKVAAGALDAGKKVTIGGKEYTIGGSETDAKKLTAAAAAARC